MVEQASRITAHEATQAQHNKEMSDAIKKLTDMVINDRTARSDERQLDQDIVEPVNSLSSSVAAANNEGTRDTYMPEGPCTYTECSHDHAARLHTDNDNRARNLRAAYATRQGTEVASIVDLLHAQKKAEMIKAFDGLDAEYYLRFKSDLLDYLDRNNIEASERVQYLRRYVIGDAGQLISSYLNSGSHEQAFQKAIDALDTKYNDPIAAVNNVGESIRAIKKVRTTEQFQELLQLTSSLDNKLQEAGMDRTLFGNNIAQVIAGLLPENLRISVNS